MEIISSTPTVNIERRTIKTDWSAIDETVTSTEAAKSRIDYLRSVAGTELYRVTVTTKTIYSY